jgi:hypothetical protein
LKEEQPQVGLQEEQRKVSLKSKTHEGEPARGATSINLRDLLTHCLLLTFLKN